MNKKIGNIVIIAIALILTFVVCCWVFDTTFAEVTIDWFAFLAGIFLIVEGIWKMLKSKEAFFPNQFFRVLRIIIGTNVFTIHLLQFMRY